MFLRAPMLFWKTTIHWFKKLIKNLLSSVNWIDFDEFAYFTPKQLVKKFSYLL